MRVFVNHCGKKFGYLTVLNRGPNSNTGQTQWYCKCDCGNETLTRSAQLVSGKSKSCGCAQRYAAAKFNTIHGNSSESGVRSGEYKSWANMIARCTNPKASSYEYYGARGITVCNRWRKFENFLADMGPRPSPNYSIERDNTDGNYIPENCSWLPMRDQPKNRSNCIFVKVNGERLNLKAASERLGIAYGTVRSRIRRGATPQAALSSQNG